MQDYSDYSKLIIEHDESIINALRKMDSLRVKLLLVFRDQAFFSLLSIGDIQRALIKNENFNTPIGNILRAEITVCSSEDSFEEIREKMMAMRTECMPVLNKDGQLFKVFLWEDVFTGSRTKNHLREKIPVVIMAGGKGTRLKPLTNIIPKPLVPIGEKPIIEVIIDKFNSIGVVEFFLSVNYKAEMIKFYFDNLEGLNYNINYCLEEKPSGTAGSLSLLRNILKTPFFVTNCDIIIEQDYWEIYEYHVQNRNDITLVASIKSNNIPYGTVESGENGELVSLKEKPDFTYMINSGMYILEPGMLELIPENAFYHITDLISDAKKLGKRVGVFPISEGSWFDMGDWFEYRKLLEYNGFNIH